MSAQIYLITIFVIAGTCILIFGMRAFARRQAATAATSKEAAYRDLATKATAAQGETAAKLSALHDQIAGASKRLEAVEKLLKDVG